MSPTWFQQWMADLNVTTYKSVWSVWLWIATGLATFAIMLISAWRGTDIGPMVSGLYASWLFGLAAFSGITEAGFYGKRTTDTNYQIAKNSGAPPVVAASGEAKVDVNVQPAPATPPPTVVPPAVTVTSPTVAPPGAHGATTGTPLPPASRTNATTEPNVFTDDERGD